MSQTKFMPELDNENYRLSIFRYLTSYLSYRNTHTYTHFIFKVKINLSVQIVKVWVFRTKLKLYHVVMLAIHSSLIFKNYVTLLFKFDTRICTHILRLLQSIFCAFATPFPVKIIISWPFLVVSMELKFDTDLKEKRVHFSLIDLQVPFS